MFYVWYSTSSQKIGHELGIHITIFLLNFLESSGNDAEITTEFLIPEMETDYTGLDPKQNLGAETIALLIPNHMRSESHVLLDKLKSVLRVKDA